MKKKWLFYSQASFCIEIKGQAMDPGQALTWNRYYYTFIEFIILTDVFYISKQYKIIPLLSSTEPNRPLKADTSISLCFTSMIQAWQRYVKHTRVLIVWGRHEGKVNQNGDSDTQSADKNQAAATNSLQIWDTCKGKTKRKC